MKRQQEAILTKGSLGKSLLLILIFTLNGFHSIDGFARKKVPEYSTAGFYSIENSPRIIYNFNPGWKFRKGHIEGAEKKEYDDSLWEIVNLPHGLEILGENASGMRNYQGEACYRKIFSVDGFKTKNIYLI
jgi:hypothetical protein